MPRTTLATSASSYQGTVALVFWSALLGTQVHAQHAEGDGTMCGASKHFGVAGSTANSFEMQTSNILPSVPPVYDPSQCPNTFFTGMGNVHWLHLHDVRPGIPLKLQTCGFDTDLSVFRGTSCGSLIQLACNGDISSVSGDCNVVFGSEIDFTPSITFTPESGYNYYIVVGGYNGAVGTATLKATYLNSCWAAEHFGVAGSTANSFEMQTSNILPSVPPVYDPSQCPNTFFTGIGNVHWLHLHDVRPGIPLKLQTCGFDTDLSVFRGTSCGSLIQLACNGDISSVSGDCNVVFGSEIDFTPSITFTPESGYDYYIVVGGYNGAVGTATLKATYATTGAQQDPHLSFAHGGSADFRGCDGCLFNFLSARDVSVNVKTEVAIFELHNRTVHGTFLTEVHIAALDRPRNVWYNVSFWAAQVGENNWGWREMSGTCAHKFFQMGPNSKRACFDVITTTEYASASIELPEWTVQVKARKVWNRISGPVHRLDFFLKPKVAERDLAAWPHGIIGQSYDGDNLAISGNKDDYSNKTVYTSAMAEGAIEGVATDYQVSWAFETRFKYSRFDSTMANSRPRSIARPLAMAQPDTMPLFTSSTEMQ